MAKNAKYNYSASDFRTCDVPSRNIIINIIAIVIVIIINTSGSSPIMATGGPKPLPRIILTTPILLYENPFFGLGFSYLVPPASLLSSLLLVSPLNSHSLTPLSFLDIASPSHSDCFRPTRRLSSVFRQIRDACFKFLGATPIILLSAARWACPCFFLKVSSNY